MKFIDLTKKSAYIVKCADWAVVIEADSSQDACTESLIEMLNDRGKMLKLSSVIVSERIDNIMYAEGDEDMDDDHIEYHSVSRMLANAGLHELSSNVKYLSLIHI